MLRNSKTRFCETRFELFSSRAIIVCVGEVLKCRVVEVRSRTTSNVVRDPSEESKAETRDAEKNNQARTAVVVVVCLFFSLVLLLSFGSRVSRLGVDPTVTQRAARHPIGPREREKKRNIQKQPQRTITIPVMTMMLRSSSRSVQSMLARTNRAAIPLRRVASTQSAALLGSQSENGNNGFGDSSSSSSWSSSWSRFGAMTTTLAGMSAAFLALQVSRDRKAECCGIAGVVANQQHDAR